LSRVTRGRDEVPLSLFRHRVLVFLAKEPALDQDVEAGRVVSAARLAHVEIDRARDLLSTEDELRFLFALRLGSPDGHRDGHQHHHYADADQQCRHRIPALAALTTL
jgi:hypothetical protein